MLLARAHHPGPSWTPSIGAPDVAAVQDAELEVEVRVCCYTSASSSTYLYAGWKRMGRRSQATVASSVPTSPARLGAAALVIAFHWNNLDI